MNNSGTTDVMINMHLLAFALILLGAVLIIGVGWRWLDKRLTSRAEQEVDESFDIHRDVSGRQRPPWDGEDWPQQIRQYQNDPWVYSQPPYAPRFPQRPVQRAPQLLADTRIDGRSPRFIPTQVMPAIMAQQARPSCPASGPMPGLDANLETEAFIASMRAETDRWISYYSMAELAGV